jgi:multiple sugar transport system ATP-binding protein
MAELRLEHIKKIYDGGVLAVEDFDIDIKDGEFIVIVGPSGCGKSTTLRMIAGLEDITEGHAYLIEQATEDKPEFNKEITNLPSKDRDMAMVFQNYALYAHMTIYQNMAFSLTLRKTDKVEIHKKVMHAAEILDLKTQLNKKPKQLSGGQRQRVALGRAIVRNPRVFLFDEPLSNLDAKLRVSMRREVKLLHQKLGATMIYVTHDQVEALTLADRIVVMSMGKVQQIGTPLEVYSDPNNVFVASFIGNPPMNFLPGSVDENGVFTCADFSYKLDEKRTTLLRNAGYCGTGKELILGIRPEHFLPGEDLKITNELLEHMGPATLFHCYVGNTKMQVKLPGWLDYEDGAEFHVSFNQDMICFFDKETTDRIR